MTRSPAAGPLSAALVAAAAVVTWASIALAQEGLPLGWGWQQSDDALTITIEAFDLMTDLEVTLRRHADGRRFEFSHEGLPIGRSWEIDVPSPTRTSEYTLTIEAGYADLSGRVEDTFTIEVLAPMEFTVDEGPFDAESHRFTLTMTQPAGHVEIVVRADTGALLTERTVQFAGEPAGAPLEVTWAQPPGRVLTVDVRAVSEGGSWASRQYIPWKVEFDAAYVHFETGSAEIPVADEPMLRARLAQIQTTADQVAEWVTVELYVAGYTDTVGSDADNQRLSDARARSIAGFFRGEGARFSIYYQGFGESALAVQTADNVDEPENRRSIFILSTQPPPRSSNIPRDHWENLD